MRYARIRGNGTARFVRLVDDRALVLTSAPWAGGSETGEVLRWSYADLCSPVTPSKVLCVGRNYTAHAKELGHEVPKEPLLFLKPPSSIVGPGESVILPRESQRVEHEAELGIVVGSRIKNVSADEARRAVFGYTCAGDITARDLQKSDGQWSRAKGFDTFCPVGPWIETEINPDNLRITCRVRDDLRQDGRTSAMVFPVATLVSYMSHAMTLEPGDLLLSGTPEGVGPLAPDDELAIEIEGIGTLRCGVRSSS